VTIGAPHDGAARRKILSSPPTVAGLTRAREWEVRSAAADRIAQGLLARRRAPLDRRPHADGPYRVRDGE
jgi:hypothetical protein